MRLTIKNLIPTPLKEAHNTYNATAWGQEMKFNQGEQILFSGPTGSGKTLLMNWLYGLDKDYEGEIHWSVYNMAQISREQLSQLRAASISMVAQKSMLFEDLTVWENIDIKRRLTDSVTAHDAEKWLDKLGLKSKAEVKAGILSPGEKQKVCIVRALMQPFDWLLLDEPFMALDFFNKQKAIALIEDVCQLTNAGIIVASAHSNDDFVYDKKIML